MNHKLSIEGDELYAIGVKAGNLKQRTVNECLHCEKSECNCCPVSEKEEQ